MIPIAIAREIRSDYAVQHAFESQQGRFNLLGRLLRSHTKSHHHSTASRLNSKHVCSGFAASLLAARNPHTCLRIVGDGIQLHDHNCPQQDFRRLF